VSNLEPALVPEHEPRGQTEADVLAWLDQWERNICRRAAIYAQNSDMKPAVANLVDAFELLPAARQTCRGAPRAVLEAFVLGAILGRLVGDSQTWGYSWWEELNRPDTQRGMKVKKAAADGGKRTKERLQGRSAERYRKAVMLFEELHRKHPRRSRWDLSQQIGRALEVHPRTVMRYLKKVAKT
jgi:hypothetical protein